MIDRYRTGEYALTRNEYHLLLSKCNNLETEVLIKLAVSTGLRRYDISQIEIQNIDQDNDRLTFFEAKKGRIRSIDLDPEVTRKISQYLFTINARRSPGRRYLFSWGGTRFGDRTAHRRLQDLCDRAGIPRRPFHALRATCIKFCQAAGWPPEAVSELTGDTIRVIQEHYLTPSQAEMRELTRSRRVLPTRQDS